MQLLQGILESWINRLETSLADTVWSQVKDTVWNQIKICAEISIACRNLDPTKRPDIQSVIEMLAATESRDYTQEKKRRKRREEWNECHQ